MSSDFNDFNNFRVVSWRVSISNSDIRVLIILFTSYFLYRPTVAPPRHDNAIGVTTTMKYRSSSVGI
ncbi:hypothetical protein LENED_003562 [Lentinula edodes]|uniref:Uncharacterized protein n=1 Tax=Lentinula edodes TaxID=5353 RepID=A0A1Q3E3V8_LENED|nr:hypothetical protein LENED_003562 [Lentinula edodes]